MGEGGVLSFLPSREASRTDMRMQRRFSDFPRWSHHYIRNGATQIQGQSWGSGPTNTTNNRNRWKLSKGSPARIKGNVAEPQAQANSKRPGSPMAMYLGVCRFAELRALSTETQQTTKQASCKCLPSKQGWVWTTGVPGEASMQQISSCTETSIRAALSPQGTIQG